MDDQLPGIHPDRIARFGPPGQEQCWIHEDSLELYDNVGIDTVFRVEGFAGDIYFEIDARATRKAVPGYDPAIIDGEPVVEELPGWWVHRLEDTFDPDVLIARILGGGEA